MKPLLSLLFVLAFPALVVAAGDPAEYRLTAAFLQKVEAIEAEARRLGLKDDEDEDSDEADEEDLEGLVRRIERDPQRRALLARHGLTARELALGTHALLHAGTYLAFEKSLDKQAGARLYAGYTAAQKANIELLRSRQAAQR